MDMVDFAKRELSLLRGDDLDPMQDAIENDILEIIDIFSKQGHSGGSAGYVLPILERLLNWEIIAPITGGDSEWEEVGDGLFQNKRCFSVFKSKDRFDGQPYTIDGKIFSDDDGESWFTSRDSCVPIEFPYTPSDPEKVYVDKEEEEIKEEVISNSTLVLIESLGRLCTSFRRLRNERERNCSLPIY
jgi:hypothetical protein